MNSLLPCRPAQRPRRLAALLLLLAVLPGAALAQKPAAGTPAVLSQKAMLASDTRLDRPVTLDLISVPLGEVLQQESLDKSTDKMEDGHRFLLTAAPDCADLKMQIRLNARPLRTLMTALAEMVPGVWTPTPHGYQLSMTRQAADARAEWWRLFLGEREKALALQRQAVLAAMETKARRRQAGDPDPEQSDLAVEADVANQHDFFHSLPKPLKEQIAANMDESAFYEADSVSFGNGGEKTGAIGWLSQMPPQTQERFKEAMQVNADRLAQAPPALQKYAVQARKDMAAFDPSKVYFLFQNGGTDVIASPFNGPPSVGGLLELAVPRTPGFPVLTLDQTELFHEMYGGFLTAPEWKRQADDLIRQGDAAPPDFKHIIYLVYGMGDAAPPEWKQMAAYQKSRVWPNILPKLPEEDGGIRRPNISRAAQIDWLGQQGHMEYVSDYYCDYHTYGGYAMPEAQKKMPVRRPLAVELDELAAKRDISWTEDADGITLVRNNRWYRDDGLEVPQPLLRRWFGTLLQARRQLTTFASAQAAARPIAPGAAPPKRPVMPQSPEERTAVMKQTWDWAAEVSGALTPWQIRNGLALFQPEERELAAQNDATAKLNEGLRPFLPFTAGSSGTTIASFDTQSPPFNWSVAALKMLPHTVQFYGSLDDGQRTALLEGRLPVSALSPSQLTQAVLLQPLLPQAMQNLPAPSIYLGLLSGMRGSEPVVFGDFPFMNLELSTPPPSAP